jgi:protein SCO1
MKRILTRRQLLGALALMPAGVALATRAAAAAEFTKASPKSAIGARLPHLDVVNQDGKKLRFYDDLIAGRIVLINFFYAECEKTCPPMTANLVKVQKLLGDRVGKDIFMYSLTLKPQHDSPEVLKHYAQMYEVKPGWQFLTGTPEVMETLRRKLGFIDPDPAVDADKSTHIGIVLYGNDSLNRWSACPALTKASEIARSISWLDPGPHAPIP